MKTEKIVVENMKCSGCERTIVNAISKMNRVKKVTADKDSGIVTIDYEGDLNKGAFQKELTSLGYPEIKTEKVQAKIVESSSAQCCQKK